MHENTINGVPGVSGSVLATLPGALTPSSCGVWMNLGNLIRTMPPFRAELLLFFSFNQNVHLNLHSFSA